MEFLLAACRLQFAEREKFRDLMEIRLDKQERDIENKQTVLKREGGKVGTNHKDLDNSLAEKTWLDLDLALENVKQPGLKSESAIGSSVENQIKEEIKVEIKTEVDPDENFQCGKCGKYSASGISLGIHMRQVHKESSDEIKSKQMFNCKFCTKSYPLKHQMGVHVKKHHSKPPQLTKKRGNGPKQKVGKEEENETDKIQKFLMEFSEDEDDGVEVKASKEEIKSEQIMMDVDKLISESNTSKEEEHNEQLLISDKQEVFSLEPKKDTVEHLLAQLRESKYFKSQKNLFFECPPKVCFQCTCLSSSLSCLPRRRKLSSSLTSSLAGGQRCPRCSHFLERKDI